MNEETLDLEESMDVNGGFVVHPNGYRCQAQCLKQEFVKNPATAKIETIIMHIDADGATIQERISLIAKGRYTIDIIKWKLSTMLVSFGIRKTGEKSAKLVDDIKACVGEYCHVVLKVDKFQSKTTGKWLENNKVEKFLSLEEFERPATDNPGEKSSDDPQIDTTPPAESSAKKYTFG